MYTMLNERLKGKIEAASDAGKARKKGQTPNPKFCTPSFHPRLPQMRLPNPNFQSVLQPQSHIS